MSAVAVADPDWRDVLTHGPAVWSTVRRDAGAESAVGRRRFGRFGWINLIGLLAAHAAPEAVATTSSRSSTARRADELRFVVAGGRRRADDGTRLGAERLRDALAGDAPRRRELSRALAAPGMLLDVTGWVRRTSDAELKTTLQRLLDGWPDLPVDGGPASGREARGGSARSVRRRCSPR